MRDCQFIIWLTNRQLFLRIFCWSRIWRLFLWLKIIIDKRLYVDLVICHLIGVYLLGYIISVISMDLLANNLKFWETLVLCIIFGCAKFQLFCLCPWHTSPLRMSLNFGIFMICMLCFRSYLYGFLSYCADIWWRIVV